MKCNPEKRNLKQWGVKQWGVKQWGVTALLASGMLLPPAASPFIAGAGASPILVNPTALNPTKSNPARPNPLPQSHADKAAADKAAIMAAYRQADAAYNDFDLEGVWQNRSETFYLIQEGGKRFEAESMKEDLAWVFKTIEAMNSTTVIQKIVVQGNKAVVTARNASTMSVPTTGKDSATVNYAFRSTDTWLKQNGCWVFAHTQIHSTYGMQKEQIASGKAAGGNASAGKLPVSTAAHIQAARKSIQAAYNRMLAAARKKDARGALGDQTADYIAILQNGSYLSGKAVQQNLEFTYSTAQSIQVSSTIEKFELKGNVANVTARGSSTMIFPAKYYGKRTVVKTTGRSLDTWVKLDGRWFIARTQSLKGSATANGKPIPVL